jgi:hypothetical protein
VFGFQQQSVATPQARERMDSPALQTLQDPILLLPWLYFRGGGFPNPSLGASQATSPAAAP